MLKTKLTFFLLVQLFGAVHQDDEFSVLQEIQQELLAEGWRVSSNIWHTIVTQLFGGIATILVNHFVMAISFSPPELAILEDYHRNMQFEEQALNALVEGMEDCGLIICPVCFAWVQFNNS